MPVKLSRLRTKGRWEYQTELIESVLSDYHTTRASISDIAQINKVSATTASKIIDGKVYLLIYGQQITFIWDDAKKRVTALVNGDYLAFWLIKKMEADLQKEDSK